MSSVFVVLSGAMGEGETLISVHATRGGAEAGAAEFITDIDPTWWQHWQVKNGMWERNVDEAYVRVEEVELKG